MQKLIEPQFNQIAAAESGPLIWRRWGVVPILALSH